MIKIFTLCFIILTYHSMTAEHFKEVIVASNFVKMSGRIIWWSKKLNDQIHLIIVYSFELGNHLKECSYYLECLLLKSQDAGQTVCNSLLSLLTCLFRVIEVCYFSVL